MGNIDLNLFQNEELSATILVTEDVSNENEIKSETNQAVESITEEIKKTEDDFNAATTYEQNDEKVRVEYMEPAGDYSISHVIIDSGQNFSVDERGNVITVISENQLQNYEYIPLDTATEVEGQTIQTRDTLQAAIESAEVDKIELLRGPDEQNIIYENHDSNSQTQTAAAIFKRFSIYLLILQLWTHFRIQDW